ncbi:ferrous iron transport protein A [Cereibacter azotoformans]|nr:MULTISPECIES: FeoA family protein [Cereibacter]AXQ95774.1 ferrous iron transport protein A [Cereibacter sphaeroides]UIJ32722.1 ferrous iron transport protein A [Cereibacter azotoformans]
MQAGQMPLAMVPEGRRVTVKALIGGCEVRRRMADLGIIPGCELGVVRCGQCGPVVVTVGDTRLAVGQEVSRKIFVMQVQA